MTVTVWPSAINFSTNGFWITKMQGGMNLEFDVYWREDMFYSLCKLSNKMQSSNETKAWNCQLNIPCRTATIKEHFKNKKRSMINVKQRSINTEYICIAIEKMQYQYRINMHSNTQKAKRDSYFVEKERGE